MTNTIDKSPNDDGQFLDILNADIEFLEDFNAPVELVEELKTLYNAAVEMFHKDIPLPLDIFSKTNALAKRCYFYIEPKLKELERQEKLYNKDCKGTITIPF